MANDNVNRRHSFCIAMLSPTPLLRSKAAYFGNPLPIIKTVCPPLVSRVQTQIGMQMWLGSLGLKGRLVVHNRNVVGSGVYPGHLAYDRGNGCPHRQGLGARG